MRIIALVIGVPASLVFMLVSMGCNWAYMSTMGRTPVELYLMGALSISVDLFKACCPYWISSALQARRYVAGAGAIALLVLCLCLSFASAIGFAAASRSGATGGRESVNAVYANAEKDAARFEAELAAIGAVRLAADVEADVNSAKLEPRWRSSKECTNATEDELRALCKRIQTLRAELARATRAAELDGLLREKRAQIAALKAQGAGEDADIQAGLLSRVTGWTVGSIQGAFAILIAVLVEFGAAFGLFFSTTLGRDSPLTITAEWLPTAPAAPVNADRTPAEEVVVSLPAPAAARKPPGLRRVTL